MFFGRHDGSFSFAENKEESYFQERKVKSFFEYEVDKVVCAVFNDREKNYIQLIDRSKKEITLKLTNPAEDAYPSQLVPISHFDKDALPYVLLKDVENVTMYDIKNNQIYWLLKGVYQTAFLH